MNHDSGVRTINDDVGSCREHGEQIMDKTVGENLKQPIET